MRLTISCRYALPGMGRCFCYRQDAAKWQTAVTKFTQGQKSGFFDPQGRFIAPIQVKLDGADGHLGPLGSAKFLLNPRRGWECGRQNIKNFHFLVKSCLADAIPSTDL